MWVESLHKSEDITKDSLLRACNEAFSNPIVIQLYVTMSTRRALVSQPRNAGVQYAPIKHRAPSLWSHGFIVTQSSGIFVDRRTPVKKDHPVNMAGSHDLQPLGDTGVCQSRWYKKDEAQFSLPSSELALSAAWPGPRKLFCASRVDSAPTAPGPIDITLVTSPS